MTFQNSSSQEFGLGKECCLAKRPAVSGDLPNIATGIFDHPATIAIRQVLWLLKRYGPGFQSTLVRRVDLVDIG